MNKKIFFSIAILSLLSLAVFVVASTGESYINIEKGWNLVYGFVPGSLEGQTLEFSHIKAIYAYIPEDNEYIRIHPNPENEKIDLVGDKYLESSVMWVYSDVSQRTEYWFEEPLSISETRLSPGYNFVRVTPDMFYEKNGQDVFSWNAVKGDCNIEKIHAWNPESQDWMPISPTQESFDFNDFYMMGMAVKVTEGCTLGESSGNINSPPQIPNNDEDSSSIPLKLGTYDYIDTMNDEEDCNQDGTFCSASSRLEYRDYSTDKTIFVHLVDITTGTKGWLKEHYANEAGGVLETIFINSNKLYRFENHELFWFVDSTQPDMILTQEGRVVGGSIDYSTTATGDNEVTKYWLSRFPSTEFD